MGMHELRGLRGSGVYGFRGLSLRYYVRWSADRDRAGVLSSLQVVDFSRFPKPHKPITLTAL